MNLKLRWAFIAIVIAWALFSMLPLNEKLKLGLDLQGGMHVVLGVDTDKAVEAKVEAMANQLRKELATEKVDFAFVQKTDMKTLSISLRSKEAFEQAKEIIAENYPTLQNISISKENTLSYMLESSAVTRVRDYAVEQSLEVVRNRIDEFGVSEPVIQRQGKKQVVVQLPGVTDPDRAIDLIGKTAQLKFYIVDDNVSAQEAEGGNIPFDDIILYQKQTDDITGQTIGRVPFVVKKDAVLTGEYLVDAEVNLSTTYNTPIVQFRLDAAGSKLFEELTADNIGNRMAIVLDDNVYSAPVIRSRIPGGSAYIDGINTMQEAKDLAIVLRAGSLPAPVSIEENRTVGPSLGQDSINSGVKAALIGLALIVAFMLVYYRMAGIVANIALATNFVIILGFMSQFGATLTLPGIAGIILTIGMSVDANVLIFERVREELRMGRTPMNALEYGYGKAFSTIMDANITTIIAAIVLFQFGTGPIKGFAVTLSIGILASLFTAIFVTKAVFWTFLRSKDVTKLSI
ncbi:protein-export membrane protein SecD [Denitrovibrio acetiphilus DSM 12809]|uniref:Protein translocase subunit SecD n=1 Tax=Denitrovibrio acetiphilus (strain DSM 12809 / NBRC 114555 / N2460) TaxID=522772 RepID=D4H483_DENA2|nr:protein translocase subunit SecD [Denitrovibrio acetiphilus]ADD69212.1 protein-export membrane protein SecD [Denitrovibrio acetiphilus DSM 12809]